jgi:hypothetical protein
METSNTVFPKATIVHSTILTSNFKSNIPLFDVTGSDDINKNKLFMDTQSTSGERMITYFPDTILYDNNDTIINGSLFSTTTRTVTLNSNLTYHRDTTAAEYSGKYFWICPVNGYYEHIIKIYLNLLNYTDNDLKSVGANFGIVKSGQIAQYFGDSTSNDTTITPPELIVGHAVESLTDARSSFSNYIITYNVLLYCTVNSLYSPAIGVLKKLPDQATENIICNSLSLSNFSWSGRLIT